VSGGEVGVDEFEHELLVVGDWVDGALRVRLTSW